MDDDATQRLPVVPLGFNPRKRRRMFNSFGQNRAQALRELGLAVDFEKVDTDEVGDARCRVTVTEEESRRVALALLVRGEEWAFVVADGLARMLASPAVEAVWYPGEEPRWGPEDDQDSVRQQ